MTWETVATFDNAVAAEMAKNLLEGHGIPVMISDEETVATIWSLSNAVGGIKLRVPAEALGRAEFLLEQKTPPPLTDADIADALAERPETAARLAGPGPPEPFDDTPTDREVDRLLKATAIALLFFPLQLYTLARLWMLRYADPPVRASDRWKVRLAYAISLPLWFAVLVPAILLVGYFYDKPTGPYWRNERFGVGDIALTIDFPDHYGYDLRAEQTVLGPANVRSFGTSLENRHLTVTIMTLDKEWTPNDPPFALQQFVQQQFLRAGAKADSTQATTLGGYPGLEVVARYPDATTRRPLFLREKVILVDRHIVILSAEVPALDSDNPDAARFFKSARIS
jgi:hypothetical protein